MFWMTVPERYIRLIDTGEHILKMYHCLRFTYCISSLLVFVNPSYISWFDVPFYNFLENHQENSNMENILVFNSDK